MNFFLNIIILMFLLLNQTNGISQSNVEWNLNAGGIEIRVKSVGQENDPLTLDLYEKDWQTQGFRGLKGAIEIKTVAASDYGANFTSYCIDERYSSIDFDLDKNSIILDIQKKSDNNISSYECGLPFARVLIIAVEAMPSGDGDDIPFSFSVDDIYLQEEIFVDLNLTHQTCSVGGNAEAIVIGGFQPYTYLWGNNNAQQEINNLTAGSYSFTVTDFSGNNSSIFFEIENEIVQEYDDNGNKIDCEMVSNTNCPYDIFFGENIKEGTYTSLNDIYLNSVIYQNESVVLKAGNSILLDDGFFINQNSSLEVDIESCY